MAHHGVELMQGGDDGPDACHGLILGLGQHFDFVIAGGHELMQRGIQEADAHGHSLQCLVQLLEIALLIGQDLLQRGLPLLHGVGADHLAECRDALRLKEHVLGTAQADAFCAQLLRLLGVGGGVGIGAHAQLAIFIGQRHDAAELTGDLGVHGGDDAVIDIAGAAVDGDAVALVEGLAAQRELPILLVHHDIAAAGNTAGTHAAGNHSRVGGHAAAHGQNALGDLHAGDILGRGLQADQDHLFLAGGPGLSVLSGEDNLAAGSSGGSAQALADGGRGLQHLGVELGMQQGIQVPGIDHGHGLLLVDHALVQQVAGDLQRGLGGTLAVTGLEHVELAVFHGELHVLHIPVVILQQGAHLGELRIGLGEFLGHLGNGHGGTDTGHHVLALGVGQEFAHQVLFASGGVAGKGDAGAGIVVQVAEHHGHDVDGSAPGIGDVVVTAVDVGAGVIPGTEHGADSLVQLGLGVAGEVHTQLGLVLRLELAG